MTHRHLPAVLAVIIASGTIALGGSAAGSASSDTVTFDIAVQPSVIHRVEGTASTATLSGAITLRKDVVCGGGCQVRVGVWAPRALSPWRAYHFDGIRPGQTLDDLDLAFRIYGGSQLPDGIHQVRIQVRNAGGSLIGSTVAERLGVYRQVLTPTLTGPSEVLEGRRIRLAASLLWLASDGFRRDYDGPLVTAVVQLKGRNGDWLSVDQIQLSKADSTKRLDFGTSRTSEWRLVVDGPDGRLVSSTKSVTVWKQTDQLRVGRVTYRAQSERPSAPVDVHAVVKALYLDGAWHAPVAGTTGSVQFREAGQARWRTVKSRVLEGKHLRAVIDPWTTGYWRVKVPGDSSDPRRIVVD